MSPASRRGGQMKGHGFSQSVTANQPVLPMCVFALSSHLGKPEEDGGQSVAQHTLNFERQRARKRKWDKAALQLFPASGWLRDWWGLWNINELGQSYSFQSPGGCCSRSGLDTGITISASKSRPGQNWVSCWSTVSALLTSWLESSQGICPTCLPTGPHLWKAPERSCLL